MMANQAYLNGCGCVATGGGLVRRARIEAKASCNKDQGLVDTPEDSGHTQCADQQRAQIIATQHGMYGRSDAGEYSTTRLGMYSIRQIQSKMTFSRLQGRTLNTSSQLQAMDGCSCLCFLLFLSSLFCSDFLYLCCKVFLTAPY